MSDAYLDTIKRFEPEIAMTDPGTWAFVGMVLRRGHKSLTI